MLLGVAVRVVVPPVGTVKFPVIEAVIFDTVSTTGDDVPVPHVAELAMTVYEPPELAE